MVTCPNTHWNAGLKSLSADTIKHDYPDQECYACARILAELKYPPEVVKEMIGDELLKQSTFYKETLEEGLSKGMEKGVAIGR